MTEKETKTPAKSTPDAKDGASGSTESTSGKKDSKSGPAADPGREGFTWGERQKPTTDAYRESWSRIFGNKKKVRKTSKARNKK
jgi:hypothetical protein